MPRINLDNVPARKAIDAEWSKGKKIAVGAAAGVICVGAIGAGLWAFAASQPPGMPRNAEDAIATIQSAKFERLDNDRKDQILAESRRLLGDLSWEERREILGDREAQRALMEASMDEAARRMARGENMGDIMGSMWGGRGRGGPRGEGGEGGDRPEMTEEQRRERAAEWERRRQEFENMSEEERRARENERREAMTDRMENQFSTGNAQNSGLRGEMFKRMSAWRDGRGGGGGGGGGGRRGGGG